MKDHHSKFLQVRKINTPRSFNLKCVYVYNHWLTRPGHPKATLRARLATLWTEATGPQEPSGPAPHTAVRPRGRAVTTDAVRNVSDAVPSRSEDPVCSVLCSVRSDAPRSVASLFLAVGEAKLVSIEQVVAFLGPRDRFCKTASKAN